MGLREQLATATKQMDGFEIPSLPSEIIELQRLFKQHEFPDLYEVASTIERNTLLSGEIIKVANQSQFKREEADDVTTVRAAVDSLGVMKLKNLVTSLAFKAQVDKEVFAGLLENSVDVANVCAELSGWVDSIDADEAYMAGLFHNAGAMIMAMRFEDYEAVYLNSLSNIYTGLSHEIKKYGTHHGVYGLLVSKKWHLENLYSQVMVMHHQKNLDVIANPKTKAMVATVQLAIAIVGSLDTEHYSGSEVKQMKQNAQQELMIDDEVVDEIRLALMSNALV